MTSLVLDFFAGGGGASSGIEAALGGPVSYAINHDPLAIAMHRANHPRTQHLVTSVWDVSAKKLAGGRAVDFMWASPDCTYHSVARGGKPFRERDPARRRRGLAWIIPYWAEAVRPRVIALENVTEWGRWGPLTKAGRPDPAREGETFRRWVRRMQNLGYAVDMRELRACDYGAPTTRKRLFVICRRDGRDIVFPDATHGDFSYQRPYRTAAECIDWHIPCPSIFERSRPLADATLRRIARGIMRYVVNDARPFIVPVTHHGDSRVHSVAEPLRTITGAQRGEMALITPLVATLRGTDEAHLDASAMRPDEPLRTISAGGTHHALIAPTIINTRNGERHGAHGEQAPRVRDIREPLPTVTAQGSQGALVAAFLAKHYGDRGQRPGSAMYQPMDTITAVDHHSLVCAFLMKYYGTEQAPQLREPLDTITTKDRFGLVMIRGEQYRIVDIGMRMLEPRELYRAQGFRPDYEIETGLDEHGQPLPFTRTAQVHMCGNSVSPPVAEALVRANVIEQRAEQAA